MSENKFKSRDAIDAELQKTKAQLAIAKHRKMKLRSQIKVSLNTETGYTCNQ